MLTADRTDIATARGHGPWIALLPHLLILGMTIAGVAYTSFTREPIAYYWAAVALIVGAMCVVHGWPGRDAHGRMVLLRTQILHWGAFLVAMGLVFTPSVQAIVNADSASLVELLLLALGTFVAGAHLPSWRMCVNGALMALCVPAIAWLDQSALLLALVAVLVLAAVGAFLWLRARHG